MAKKVLRVAVDARPLSWERARGIQRGTWSLLDNIARIASNDFDIVLFSNAPLIREVDGLQVRVLVSNQFNFAFRLLGSALEDGGFDVLLSTSPTVRQSACPMVSIIYDIYPLTYSQYLSFRSRLTWEYLMSQIAVRAKLQMIGKSRKVIVPSEQTKLDILAAKPFYPKCDIIKVAFGANQVPLEIGKERQQYIVRHELGIQGPFILYVGAVNEHKNISTLLSVYEKCSKKIPGLELVIVGEKTWPSHGTPKIEAIDGIRYWSSLDDASISALYGTTEALILISWYEGLGFPAIEAMACGAPVIASNRGSLPEVLDGVAPVFDPTNAKAMALAIEHFHRDPVLRSQAIKNGYVKVSSFSWNNAARTTLDAITEAVRASKIDR